MEEKCMAFKNRIWTMIVATLMITMIFSQNTYAGYNSGDDLDIFIDSFGNKNMVWREQINGTYQVFYGYEIVDTIYNENNALYSNQTINGNLDFDDGYLTIKNSVINGNIKTTRAQVVIEDSVINGNIKHKLGSLIIKSSNITGNVKVKNADLELRTSYVNGNVKSKTNTDESLSTILTGNDINGNVKLKSGVCYVVGNTINGNLKVKDPAIIQEVSDNDVNGNTKLTDNTSGFNGYQITNSTLDVMYPQVAIDNASGMGYVLWVINSTGTLEFWYTVSPDMIIWLEPHYGGILTYTTGNPELDLDANNGTLYITWKDGGSLTIAPDYNEPPVLQVVELGADRPVVHLNEPATISLKMGNSGNGSAIYTAVNVFDIIGDNETLIHTTEIGIVRPGTENVYEFNWTPIKTGIHYLKVEMLSNYIVHQSPAELVEGPPTIMSAGFPVSLMADEWVDWFGDKIITVADGDNYTYPSTGYNSTQINITSGNLIIQNSGKIKFNDNVIFVIVNSQFDWPSTKYGININFGGKFMIDSPLRTTVIQTPSNQYRTNTYPFLNSGTIDFLGASVTYTYGDKSSPNSAGGIYNLPNSICNLTDSWVVDSDTNSVYSIASELNIKGSNTLIGKGDDNPPLPKGTGITTMFGTQNRVIDGITIANSESYGIRAVGTGNEFRIENGTTIRNSKNDGVWFSSSNSIIKNSKIHDNGGNGIMSTGNAVPIISGNDISWNNRSGIEIDQSRPIINENNIIRFNREHGINTKNITNSGAKIEGNYIDSNFGSGIWSENSELYIANNTISSNGLGLIYRDDVENASDRNNWTTTGIWHPVNNETGNAPSWNLSHSGEWSWWFGQDSTGDYNTIIPSSGSLKSPEINLINATSASLTFWSWYETETNGTGNDWRYVFIQNDFSQQKVVQLYGDEMREWTRYIIDISEFAGSNITVSFIFITPDNANNDYQGWYIDDVEVISSYPAVEGHGIYLQGGTSEIDNNTINANNWNGIKLFQSDSSNVSKSNFSGNLGHNVIIDNSQNVRVYNSSFVKIRKGRFGILSYNSNSKIDNNTFSEGKGYGISINLDASPSMIANSFNNLSVGIHINNGVGVYQINPIIYNNSFTNLTFAGIYGGSGNYVEIIQNYFNNIQYGVQLNASSIYFYNNTLENITNTGIFTDQAGWRTLDLNLKGLFIFNNTFKMVKMGFFQVHQSGPSFIKNNTFDGNYPTLGNFAIVQSMPLGHFEIENNIIQNYNIGIAVNSALGATNEDSIISNNSFKNLRKGVLAYGSSYFTVNNNSFTNVTSTSQGIGEGTAIVILSNSYPTISKNIIEESDNGIYVNGGRPSIINNNIRNILNDGIYLVNSTSFVSNNSISNSTNGININYAGPTIYRNQINDSENGVVTNGKYPELIINYFQDFTPENSLSFPVGGGINSTNISIPKNAVINHASMDIIPSFTYLHNDTNITRVAATGDFNSDGIDDILTDTATLGRTKYNQNDGTGKFIDKGIIDNGLYGRSTTVGDFNLDGHNDTISLDLWEWNTFKFATGDGTGNFTYWGEILDDFRVDYPNYQLSKIKSGKIDGDEYSDLILLALNTTSNNTEILLFSNDGTANFTLTKQQILAPTLPFYNFQIGDLNNDSTLDLILVNVSPQLPNVYKLEFFSNDGNGNFVFENNLTTGIYAQNTMIMDLNDDQLLDVVIGFQYKQSNYVRSYYNIGSFDFSYAFQSKLPTISNFFMGLHNGNFDGDESTDFVVSYWAVGDEVSGDLYSTNPVKNATLDIFNDSFIDWSHSGDLINKVTIGDSNLTTPLKDLLQKYIDTHEPDEEGNIVIPLKFTSDSLGSITLTNLNITYIPSLLIEENIVGENLYGIRIENRTAAIYNNSISNNTYGIYLYSSTNTTIDNNTIISNNDTGLYLFGSDYNTISNNNISSNPYNIFIEGSDNNTITGNEFTWASTDGDGAFSLDDAHYNNISNNIIGINNVSHGLDLVDSNYNTVTGNNITLNGINGLVVDSDYNIFTYNDISDNTEYGMIFSGDNNSIYHNNFYNNTNGNVQASDTGTNNSWDNGYPSGGNFWSDYDGVDINRGPGQNWSGSDGIGDWSYNLTGSSNSVDNYPLMNPTINGRVKRPPLRINSNSDFNSSNGIMSGDGSVNKPWVITNYDIDGTGYGSGIYIGNVTDYYVIKNSYLHGASGNSGKYFWNAGIALYTADNGIIDNVNTSFNDYGIVSDGGDYISITSSEISYNSIHGIYLEGSDYFTIDNNIINSNTYFGISLEQGSQNNTISNNTADSNDYSLWIEESNNNTIINNKFTSGIEDGSIGLDKAFYNLIENNVISINLAHGLELTDSEYNIITGNNISLNGIFGIALWDSSNNSITYNDVWNNSDYGMIVTGNDNNIHHNNFYNNNNGSVQASDNGNNNSWDDGGEGNYWNDYESLYVPPATNNGTIWDTPYVIDGVTGSADNYPLVNPV